MNSGNKFPDTATWACCKCGMMSGIKEETLESQKCWNFFCRAVICGNCVIFYEKHEEQYSNCNNQEGDGEFESQEVLGQEMMMPLRMEEEWCEGADEFVNGYPIIALDEHGGGYPVEALGEYDCEQPIRALDKNDDDENDCHQPIKALDKNDDDYQDADLFKFINMDMYKEEQVEEK